jgi:hypothetical protein
MNKTTITLLWKFWNWQIFVYFSDFCALSADNAAEFFWTNNHGQKNEKQKDHFVRVYMGCQKLRNVQNRLPRSKQRVFLISSVFFTIMEIQLRPVHIFREFHLIFFFPNDTCRQCNYLMSVPKTHTTIFSRTIRANGYLEIRGRMNEFLHPQNNRTIWIMSQRQIFLEHPIELITS